MPDPRAEYQRVLAKVVNMHWKAIDPKPRNRSMWADGYRNGLRNVALEMGLTWDKDKKEWTA